MTTQTTGAAELPEALRVLTQYERNDGYRLDGSVPRDWALAAYNELRRLHAENEALRAREAVPPCQWAHKGCDTPNYCESVQRCTARDSGRAQPAGAATPAKPSPHADAHEIALFDEYMRGCREYNIEPDLGTAFHAGRKSARGAATPAAPAPGVPNETPEVRYALAHADTAADLLMRAHEQAPETWRGWYDDALVHIDIARKALAAAPQSPAAAPLDLIRRSLGKRGGFNTFDGDDVELVKAAANILAKDWIILQHLESKKPAHPSSQPAVTAGAVDALDAARLDYLQQTGSTVEVLPGVEFGDAWRFRVGGLHAAVGPDLRAAIDAALAARRGGA